MKHIFTQITLLAVAAVATASLIALTSCEDKKNQPWDPNAMISLRPDTKAAQAPSKANPEHLTPLEIVKQATDIWFWNKAIWADNALGRGFDIGQKDTINVRLLMFGTDIIDQYGKYDPCFIEATDVVITKATGAETMDTIAYIPNKVLRTAQPLIKAAFDAQDYETCYRLFDEAFRFTPITSAEWQELKARGEN